MMSTLSGRAGFASHPRHSVAPEDCFPLPVIHSRKRCATRLKPILSDAGVPGIASFWRRGAQALAETFQIVGDRQVGDVFHALVAELAGDPQPKRPTIAHGEFIAI